MIKITGEPKSRRNISKSNKGEIQVYIPVMFSGEKPKTKQTKQ